MRYCANCTSRVATQHVTVEVTVYGTVSERKKLAQFWLCDDCERQQRKLLARDHEQPQRVAQALCAVPSY